ncbi:MAG: lipoate--protein ligase [Eubacteriales bacterium]
MIYIENNSMDAAFSFALEYYFLNEKDLGDDVFTFWRTHPTLMTGRYQITAAEINEAYAKEKQIRVVRRISGGGTIYTDEGGWQFTFITKNKNMETGFQKFTAPIVLALQNLGIEATLSGRNDLLINGKKFSGNAQHHSKLRMLHHGSILYNTNLEELVRSISVSDDKIISKGIQSIRQRVTNIIDYMDQKLDPLEFRALMVKSILPETGVTYILTDADTERINQIADEIFRNWEWNYGSSPAYQITKSRRYAGGKLEICLNLTNGRIEGCKLYGDFFFYGDINGFTKCLIGCPLREEDLRAALSNALQYGSFFQISTDELLACLMQ